MNVKKYLKLFKSFLKKNNSSLSKGFTLIELTIFMAILTILLLVLSQAFATILDVQKESRSFSSIDSDGRFILARFAYDFQSADSADSLRNYIDTPAPGDSSPILKIRINSVLYTYAATSSGFLQMTTPILNNLNSSESSISGLLFQRIGDGSNRDTIRVNFRLTSKTKKRSGYEYKDFQSTYAMP